MYHVKYTRKRTTDSVADDDVGGTRQVGTLSWRLFFAVILIQITCRSLWTSLGVIGCVVLDREQPWHLLAVPTAFAVTWGITEECMRRVCARMGRADDFMYAVLGGTSLNWLGTLVAVECPLTTPFLVFFIGVVGGCGASMSATAANELVRKHLPNRAGVVRFCQQITAAASFFLIPLLSYSIMDAFGEHGGLLIHSGIVMQGLIGAALIRGTIWEEPNERAIFYREDGNFFSSDCSEWNDDGSVELQELHRLAPSVPVRSPPGSPTRLSSGPGVSPSASPVSLAPPPNLPSSSNSVRISYGAGQSSSLTLSPTRVAFGIKTTTDNTPTADTRRQRFAASRGLPSISEEIECDESTAAAAAAADAAADVEISPDSAPPGCPPGSSILDLPEVLQASSPPPPHCPTPDSPTKPPRTFEHVFPPDRLVVDGARSGTQLIRARYDCETGEMHTQPIDTEDEARVTPCTIVRMCTQEAMAAVWGQTRRARPLAVPAALLLASSQMALLSFAALTPYLLTFQIADASRVDGAYSICVMGFTWLCFVMASPCFASVQLNSHQLICMLSLLGTSATLYLMSTCTTQDETILYGSLFGLFYGVGRLTTRSVLKMAFGTENLHQLGLPLSILAGAFHLLTLLLISQFDLGERIRRIFMVPASLLLVSVLFWSVQGCVMSVRAKRGTHDFTWSRRRRVS